MKYSELISTLKNDILTNELYWHKDKYDQVEFMVSGNRTPNHLKIEVKRQFIKDGKKEEVKRGVEQNAYKELFDAVQNLHFLHIWIDQEEMKISANIPVEAHGIEQLEACKMPLDYLHQRMNPHLEAGAVYINSFYVDEAGNSGLGLFYKYIDGVKQQERVKGIDVFDESDLIFPLILTALAKTFTKGRKTQIIAQKDQPIQLKEANPHDLLATLVPFYDAIYSDYIDNYEINCHLEFKAGDYDWQIVDIKDDGEILLGGKKEALSYLPLEDLEYLYLYLNQSIQQLAFTIKASKLSVSANPAFPEFGIEAMDAAPMVVDPTDLTTICKFIESGRKEKLEAAIEAVYENEASLARIEQRYLPFVQAQLENKAATLKDITEELFSEDLQRICLGNRPAIAKDYISFGYQDEEESKQIIDLIGALTASCVDVGEFSEEYDATYAFASTGLSADSLSIFEVIHERYRTTLKQGLLKEAQLHPEGWWSKTCKHLAELNLRKILVEKSMFFKADRLPFLEAYVFYLNATIGNHDSHIDVFNAELHDLTPMYWRFQVIPKITWFQSSPSYPLYPYQQPMDVWYKVDNGDFERLDLSKLKTNN